MTQGNDLAGKDNLFRRDFSNISPEHIKEYFFYSAKRRPRNRKNDDSAHRCEICPRNPNLKRLRSTKRSAFASWTRLDTFLIASSPRMRALALDTIQNSIILLNDRPQELSPAILEMWPSIVRRILKRSENEPEMDTIVHGTLLPTLPSFQIDPK